MTYGHLNVKISKGRINPTFKGGFFYLDSRFFLPKKNALSGKRTIIMNGGIIPCQVTFGKSQLLTKEQGK